MKNPKNYMETYLNQLINNFVFLKVTIKELKIINHWKSNGIGINTLNISHTFFKSVIETFWINVIIELNKLLSKKEKKTLYDWLEKANEHASSLKPMEVNLSYENNSEFVDLNSTQYKNEIQKHINELNSYSPIIKKLKKLREKTTHSDSDYFTNPKKVIKKYPIDLKQVDDLVNCIEKILSYHHISLLYSSMDFNLKASGNVDNILRHAEAFQKIRTDPKVINSGIRPIDYIKSNKVEF